MNVSNLINQFTCGWPIDLNKVATIHDRAERLLGPDWENIEINEAQAKRILTGDVPPPPPRKVAQPIPNPTTKTGRRANWLIAHADQLEAARTPEEGSPKNARFRRGMSGGGWGYWVWAFRLANIDASAQRYWSGSNPTPSTAINRGLANYILDNAPEELL